MATPTPPAQQHPTVAALVLAAGQGLRARGGTGGTDAAPKQFRDLMGKPVLRWPVEALLAHPRIATVHVVAAPGEEERCRAMLAGLPVTIGTGGKTRQQSALLGLKALQKKPPAQVLIHDAARPIVPHALIDRVLDGLQQAPGACPALAIADSIRRGGRLLEQEVAREGLWRVQTPQGFDFAAILAAHERAAGAPDAAGATDDAALLHRMGGRVLFVAGDARAMKITTPADFAEVERMIDTDTVTGSGFDVHRFGPGDGFMLCGVRIPHSHGLVGHSDADVALHALTDALLGALAAGDIGEHFPPNDPRWKNAASERFVRHALQLVQEAGGRILHIDLTIIAEVPRLGPHKERMRAQLQQLLVPHQPRISLKATTTEGLGFTGRREGIAAQALATLRLPRKDSA